MEYKTGCTEFLPYYMVQSDDPLAVAEYILASNLSCTKAEAHLARWARLFLRSVKKTVRRLLVIHQSQSLSSSCRSVNTVQVVQAPKKRGKKKGANARKNHVTKYGPRG